MWAALYPGQGSQHVGMGQFLFEEFKIARITFEEASDAIGISLDKLCFHSAESELAMTAHAQPALLTVSVAAYRALSSLVPLPLIAAAGHSIGEYAAIVNSGAMGFADAVRAVRKRGEFMQSAVPLGEGGMTAVLGATAEEIQKLCAWATMTSGLGPVEPANDNAPGQIVISGKKSTLDWIPSHYSSQAFEKAPARLKFIALNVSAPFHCSLMKSAEEGMRSVLHALHFQDAEYPIVQNVAAEPVSQGDMLRINLIRQISAPVKWVDCIQTLKKMSARQFIEIGSGKVLSGLVKKIDSELVTLHVHTKEDLKTTEKILSQSITS